MPLTGAQTRAQLADQARNPRRTVAGTGQVVQLTLVYQGVNFIPEALFDAVETLYGSGKVTGDTDTMGQRQFTWRIKP